MDALGEPDDAGEDTEGLPQRNLESAASSWRRKRAARYRCSRRDPLAGTCRRRTPRASHRVSGKIFLAPDGYVVAVAGHLQSGVFLRIVSGVSLRLRG